MATKDVVKGILVNVQGPTIELFPGTSQCENGGSAINRMGGPFEKPISLHPLYQPAKAWLAVAGKHQAAELGQRHHPIGLLACIVNIDEDCKYSRFNVAFGIELRNNRPKYSLI